MTISSWQTGDTKYQRTCPPDTCNSLICRVHAGRAAQDKNRAISSSSSNNNNHHQHSAAAKRHRDVLLRTEGAPRRRGEFLVADGRRLFRDLSPELLRTLYERQIRYSVMELPFFGWMDSLPEPVWGPVGTVVKGLVGTAINAKVDFDVELLWQNCGYDNTRLLQAQAPRQPPIVAHPVTGDPTWFCNVHSHSSKLRHDREKIYGAERFEDGASRINKSDMFFGDDGELTEGHGSVASTKRRPVLRVNIIVVFATWLI